MFFRRLFWLGILGGAATGIAFPTKGAVDSIYNRQKIREGGWLGSEAQTYENYWYGEGGFGDKRDTQITNGNWKNSFDTALSGIRSSWGKKNVGEGLEKGFQKWLERKNICKTDSGSGNGCYVGSMEFIDKHGETLFGRIPVRDNTGKHNLYVQWKKCKSGAKASAIWKGRKRSQGQVSSSSVGAQNNNNHNWCFVEETKSK